MSKKLLTLAMAVVFTVSVAGISMAAGAKCTVESVDGDKVTMTCKKADFKAGDSVTVKASKKKAIEGC